MTPLSVIIIIAVYFAAMLVISTLSGKGSKSFYAQRGTSWWVVAFAMIGSCMSGVTFVSVPGMVGSTAFGYLQMCLGFFVGYLVIAFVLTPLYFRMRLVSIYGYLQQRFGAASYKTGAWFFFISKMLGASVRLFLVCLILQMLVFDPLGLPFWLNALANVGIVLAYTFRGGVKSVIWTDNLKTFCMLAAVVLCTVFISRELGFSSLWETVKGNGMSRVFFFDDVNNPEYFWKQFLGGIFMVVAMTGLDQDLMQRTLACKDTSDSQKNLIISSILQTVVIAMFLILGLLMYLYAGHFGIAEKGDKLFPAVAMNGPAVVGVMFVLGLVSCAYSAGGSALTALTTSFTVDILETASSRTRKRVHIGMAMCMAAVIIVFETLNDTSAIDAVYKLAGYTYGPILGMFAFGILMPRKQVRDRLAPLVAVVSPLICLVLHLNSARWFGGYTFSYELLPLNALFTFIGLCLLIRRNPSAAPVRL